MPHHQQLKVEGRIADVFFHRFVLELATGGKILADLGPEGARRFALETGTEVVLEGEMKPSELKVETIARRGEAPLAVPHKPKHGHHGDADPAEAIRAVTQAGFEPVGAPRRKPKHFEILGRKGSRFVECHVEFDGHIRKEKPIAHDDQKWSYELTQTA